jgi:homoserine kinase
VSAIRVTVPGSSANLGPGFDAFAAALALHLELEVRETGRFAVQTELAIARDRRNLVVRGFARLAPPDRFAFRIDSAIPLSGGVGSSAAAYVAGLLAADRLAGAGADVLALATELEGHPDNVAAALHGGFVICADGAVTRLDAPPGLAAVLVVPAHAVRTRAARAVMPAEVPLAEAVFNTAHGALLAAGLASGDLELVARGLSDRLHQPRRERLYPRSMALVQRAPELGALGATISGAGPTVLVWCTTETAAGVADALHAEADGWAQVLPAPFEPRGATLVSL